MELGEASLLEGGVRPPLEKGRFCGSDLLATPMLVPPDVARAVRTMDGGLVWRGVEWIQGWAVAGRASLRSCGTNELVRKLRCARPSDGLSRIWQQAWTSKNF